MPTTAKSEFGEIVLKDVNKLFIVLVAAVERSHFNGNSRTGKNTFEIARFPVQNAV